MMSGAGNIASLLIPRRVAYLLWKLPWHQPEPSRQLATVFEGLDVTNGCQQAVAITGPSQGLSAALQALIGLGDLLSFSS